MGLRIFGRQLLAQFPLLDGCFRRFVWSRIHFAEAEMRFLNALPAGSIDVALDVGAAMGEYSWILSRVARQVIAFEPGASHHEYLSRLLLGTNISLVRAAAGAAPGRVALYTPGSDSNARHSATTSQDNPVISQPHTSIDQVEQITLDAFVGERLEMGRTVDLLKIDVEGSELNVLEGALELLAAHHPLTICEIEARHNPDYAEVLRLLRGLGYATYFFRAHAVEPFDGESIEHLQRPEDLRFRTGQEADPDRNRYINNFVFQHPQSRLKVTE
jgi:FkbM family methyltransferase